MDDDGLFWHGEADVLVWFGWRWEWGGGGGALGCRVKKQKYRDVIGQIRMDMTVWLCDETTAL